MTTRERELYQKKLRAQLDEWKAEIRKIEARAAGASADAQLEMHRHVKALKGKIEEGGTRLAALAEATDAAWESLKEGVESSWKSLKRSFLDARSRFKP